MSFLPSEPLRRETNQSGPASLYDQLGGEACLARVHRRLYDKIFNHPALKAFFDGKDRDHQETQQTDFMASKFGGPNLYRGRLPDGAHQHMYITDAHFELRHALLAETLDECGVAPDLRDRWLAIDHSFKSIIVKNSLSDCTKRYNTDTIIIAP
jgi:hemoglobin